MRTLKELDLFILQEVQWALRPSYPILQWWLGRGWWLSHHKEPHGGDKGEVALGEGPSWYKKFFQ